MIMNRQLILIGIGMLLLSSCTKEPDDISPTDKPPTIVQLTEAETARLPLLSKNHRRTAETVLAFAESYINATQPESKTTTADLSICDSVLLKGIATKGTDLNAAPIYVVSRGKGQGFVLVAGDNRVIPVWGIIEKGNYSEGINPNFDFMMGRLQEEILLAISGKESLRDSIYENLRIKLGLDKAPETKADDGLVPDPPGPPDVFYPEDFDRTEMVEKDPYFVNEIEYRPLLKTEWGQGWPYNAFRSDNCNAGCEAASAAQIMAYHKYPIYFAPTGHTYLWNQFGNIYYEYSKWNTDAVTSISNLYADLGRKDYLNIDYDDGKGTADTKNIVRTLKAFGYTMDYENSNTHRVYDWSTIRKEIEAKRPVHICGDDGSLLFKNGHTWVADGVLLQHCFVTYWMRFYRNDYLICEVERGTGMRSSMYAVHHNFGWDGNYNGWMGKAPSETDRVPDCNKFNHNIKIITGIRPR